MALPVLTGKETFQVLGQDANGYPAASTETTTTGAVAALANELAGDNIVNTNLNTVGNGTLTAAALTGRLVTRGGAQTVAFTDTTDTAANIIAALPAGTQIGDSFTVWVVNTSSWAETISAGVGVTVSGLAGPIPANATGLFVATYTAAGAVTLQMIEVAYNAASGYDPSTVATQFGSSTGTFLEEGNLYREAFLAAGAVVPAATAADNVLAVYSIPANALDGFSGTNRGLTITAAGTFANNANTKTAKIIFAPATAVVGSTVGTGGMTLATTGATSAGNVGWSLSANVFKVGAANSNTQYAQEMGVIIGTNHGGMGVAVYPTATENAPILIAITGNAATATADILLNFVEVNAMN